MRKFIISFLLFTGLISAATITNITCSANVATVTVANSLIASQGFEITGNTVSSYNINGTAVTANSTSFTFKISCNGTGTGGTFIPAPEILVLSLTVNAGVLTATDLFWNTTVTAAPCPSCTSQWPAITAAQLAAINAGTTIESAQQFNLPITTSTANLNTIVQTQFNSVQAAYALNLVQFIGFCYNGTSWSSSCN